MYVRVPNVDRWSTFGTARLWNDLCAGVIARDFVLGSLKKARMNMLKQKEETVCKKGSFPGGTL